ncbi:hypothetical protein M422DRAFT_148558, partial [Sphaerobolus stellatus SS14]
AVVNWPEPETALELLGFIGLAGYFYHMIPGFATITAPLTDITPGLSMDKWGEKHQKAFSKLKVLLTSEPILKAPIYDRRPFKVTSNGSKIGFGGMLSQQHEEQTRMEKS